MKTLRFHSVLRASATALAAVLLAGCASTAKLSPPDDFAELDQGDTYDFRATNASGVVMGVRVEKNDPRGNLDFWVAALDYKLQKSGYTKKTARSEKIGTASLEGARVKYEITRAGRPHAYWLTVFVEEDRVIVVEAAGDEAYFDADVEKKIDAATRTLTLG